MHKFCQRCHEPTCFTWLKIEPKLCPRCHQLTEWLDGLPEGILSHPWQLSDRDRRILRQMRIDAE